MQFADEFGYHSFSFLGSGVLLGPDGMVLLLVEVVDLSLDEVCHQLVFLTAVATAHEVSHSGQDLPSEAGVIAGQGAHHIYLNVEEEEVGEVGFIQPLLPLHLHPLLQLARKEVLVDLYAEDVCLGNGEEVVPVLEDLPDAQAMSFLTSLLEVGMMLGSYYLLTHQLLL